ncbi:MAG: helix-turn-helix domain-containing protein [Bacteroidales bacterium]|nr:helix-turn-helix domain-containing protein [Bacteroidales bacterium]
MDIINDSEDELISIPELCGLVGVSERTLLYAFQNKFQISPSDYIKSVRLNKVRRDLFQLKDQNASISTIAGKYHFWHMGQFAQDFRTQFGILPSSIVQRNT